LRKAAELGPGDFEDFLYAADDPSIVTLLSEGNVALWGISD
jgi:hypothetical protein